MTLRFCSTRGMSTRRHLVDRQQGAASSIARASDCHREGEQFRFCPSERLTTRRTAFLCPTSTFGRLQGVEMTHPRVAAYWHRTVNGGFYEDSFVKPPLIAALMGGTLWALREGR